MPMVTRSAEHRRVFEFTKPFLAPAVFGLPIAGFCTWLVRIRRKRMGVRLCNLRMALIAKRELPVQYVA